MASLFEFLSGPLSSRKFSRRGRAAKSGEWWESIERDVIHHQVYLQRSSWRDGCYSCGVRVMFHARARDSWADGEPFLFDIWNMDFTPDGIAFPGTQGGSAWALGDAASFMEKFDELVLPVFSKLSSLDGLACEIDAQLQANPMRGGLWFAGGFVNLELGNIDKARLMFDRYLDRDRLMSKTFTPLIDELFEKRA